MSDFQVGPETFVTIRFAVHDAEGEAIGEAESLGFVFGMGELLPPVEQALEGRTAGEAVELRLTPEQAYGRRRAEAILTVSREEFPPQVSPGDRFEAENADGALLVLQVLDVTEETVTIDTNHPLAEQDVLVQAELVDVRPATQEEIAAAEAALDDEREFLEAEVPQVSAAGLLRTRPRS